MKFIFEHNIPKQIIIESENLFQAEQEAKELMRHCKFGLVASQGDDEDASYVYENGESVYIPISEDA